MPHRLYTVVSVLLYAIVVMMAGLPLYGQDSLAMQTDTVTTAKTPNKDNPVVFRFTLDEDIMPAAKRLVEEAYKQAADAKADYIIMELNTFGGRVDVADAIRKQVMDAKAITVVWINNNAASAGALISLAHDSIYMVKGASIGAATVVSGEDGTQMPDKYQSYMRSTMRSTAEAKGRDPRIAEAMVDDRIHIDGIIDSGYTLTFTTVEAIAHHYAEGEAESFDEVLSDLGIGKHTLVEYHPSAMEGVINFLLNPVVSSLLMLMIFGGLFFELQTPGVGFPLAAAIVGAVLYFAPLYLEGLAANWEILIFLLGLVLLALEIFVIPGFGAAGISGIILIVLGLGLSLIANVNFDFSLTTSDQILWAIVRVTIPLTIILGLLLAFNERIVNSRAFSRIVLKDSLDSDKGYTSGLQELSNLVGKTGEAATDLRPSGKVNIDGARFDASSDGMHIPKGTPITVVANRGNYLLVDIIRTS